MLALSLPLSGAFVATAAAAGGSSACARYRSVLDVVVRMDLDATRDAGATMSASRLTGGTSKFAAKHGSTVLDMGLMVDPIARNCLDRNAKIVSTLGPASFSQEMIEKLVAAGVDIFRLNSSHRRPGQFEELIPWIREAGRKAGRAGVVGGCSVQLLSLAEGAVKAGGGHRLTFSGLRRSTCVELSCTA